MNAWMTMQTTTHRQIRAGLDEARAEAMALSVVLGQRVSVRQVWALAALTEHNPDEGEATRRQMMRLLGRLGQATPRQMPDGTVR